MLGRSLSVLTAVLAAALLLAAPAGSAMAVRDGDPGRPPGVVHAFAVQGSNGYRGFALAGDPGDGEGLITLSLSSGRSRAVRQVGYSAPATVTEESIEADLGALGRFSLKLVPTGRTKRVRFGCGDEARWRRIETARYEGAIEFHGEEGFTAVSATSAPVDYSLYGRLLCFATHSRGHRPQMRGGRLEVDRYGGGTHELEMNVTKARPGAKASLSVWTVEELGEVTIRRAIGGRAPAGALRYDGDLRTATLRPPAPFSGRGAFHRNARPANRWTGNLTVDLPGRSGVSLTGRGLTPALVRPGR